jgi:hypothetical protein
VLVTEPAEGRRAVLPLAAERVRPAGTLVELAPTTSTAIVRELVALCDGARKGNRAASLKGV